MKAHDLNKNILDLKHSESLAKYAIFLAAAFSFWIAVFFGVKQFNQNINVITNTILATFVASPFIYHAMNSFRDCKVIRKNIKNLKNK